MEEHQQEGSDPPAAEPAGAAHPRQSSPDGRAAAPEPPRSGTAARAGDAAAAGQGADSGGVLSGGGARGDADAGCGLLQPAGHGGAEAAVVRPQGRGVQSLQQAMAREAQALGRRVPEHAPRPGRLVRQGG